MTIKSSDLDEVPYLRRTVRASENSNAEETREAGKSEKRSGRAEPRETRFRSSLFSFTFGAGFGALIKRPDVLLPEKGGAGLPTFWQTGSLETRETSNNFALSSEEFRPRAILRVSYTREYSHISLTFKKSRYSNFLRGFLLENLLPHEILTIVLRYHIYIYIN